MRACSVLAILVLAGCVAPEAVPQATAPVSAAPATGPVIFTPTAIAPRLLPGAAIANPAQQNLDRSIRLDNAGEGAVLSRPNQALRNADPGSLSGGAGGADVQLPEEPLERARIFQRR